MMGLSVFISTILIYGSVEKCVAGSSKQNAELLMVLESSMCSLHFVPSSVQLAQNRTQALRTTRGMLPQPGVDSVIFKSQPSCSPMHRHPCVHPMRSTWWSHSLDDTWVSAVTELLSIVATDIVPWVCPRQAPYACPKPVVITCILG